VRIEMSVAELLGKPDDQIVVHGHPRFLPALVPGQSR